MIRGCGIDIASNGRFLNPGTNLLRHLFSQSELEEALLISDEGARCQFYASRFAAKEALSKAFGTGFSGFSPTEVSVVSDHSAPPSFRLEGRAAKLAGDSRILLSLSHEKEYSAAMVVLDGEK